MQRWHQEMARAYRNQPAHIVQMAREGAYRAKEQVPEITAHAAVTFAKERNLEREAVVDERSLLRDGLKRSMGEIAFDAVKAEFEQRIVAGEFIGVEQPPGVPGRTFTTREMIDLERDAIRMMRAGRQTQPPFASSVTRKDIRHDYPHLSEHQRSAVDRILSNRDRILALEGVAGAGKTTALRSIRDAAEREGYRVEGFAPTSRAAQKLAEACIVTSTLQRHLVRHQEPHDRHRRLYVLDESSLASTRQMHQFLRRLKSEDRVLLVGDVRQHQPVEAGRPYQQLQEAGLETVRLDDIVRQRDPALKQVVEQLSRGEVRQAIQSLERKGRVREIPGRGQRFAAIAREYARYPEGTLVVSPDNQSRMEINQIIHRSMQAAGYVDRHEQYVRVLVPRQEITGADRQWAEQYEPGNVVRYTTGSRILGIQAGAYARVNRIHAKDNSLSVTLQGGQTVTYDPRRLQGVTLYREEDRALAVGNRVQLTAPYRERHVANRELGTIERIDARGQLHCGSIPAARSPSRSPNIPISTMAMPCTVVRAHFPPCSARKEPLDSVRRLPLAPIC